ncbi:hypothetical protein TraAM80_09684, partial [Trypanosoma rangeli]
QHTEDGATATAAAETMNSCCGNHNTDTTAAWPVLSSGGDETEVATVTVMVPTMFTTAGGRCICVREKRRIACESPYWRLLFGCPLQEGVAVSSHTDGEARLKRQKVRGDADDAERQQRGLLPAWQRHPREANTPFVPSLATAPQEPRSRSCPPPSLDDGGAVEDSSSVAFSFPYSSFTRADGSMIYFAGARGSA